MPVTLAEPEKGAAVASLRERRLRRGGVADRGRRLRIALVNNMPDAAVHSTQRQFFRLLEEGARAFDISLELASLASVERSAEARREMSGHYRAPFASGSAPDAIIVTGAEPRAAQLQDEPYWRELTNLFDAARTRTYATLASCLAAHALALHRDGVQRRRSPQKFSGLYRSQIATPHALTSGMIAGGTPHSRWNGLDEAELTAHSYVVLTRAAGAGVDMFVKDDGHLALCFQGHPEYDGDSLAREFRRDVARALAGAPAPKAPVDYYPREVEQRLNAYLAAPLSEPVPAEAMLAPDAYWRARVGVVVENWLAAIADRKVAANGPTFLRARFGG